MPEPPPPTQHTDVSAVPSLTASNAAGAGVSPGLHTRFGLASRGHGPGGTVVRVVAGACATSLIGLCAAMPAAGGSPAPGGDFDWPLRPRPGVVRAFDKPEHDWLPGHRGVDLAGDRGQVVLAAGDGIVVFAGIVAGKPVVSIDHPGGLRTTYEPVTAAIPVGRRLTRGTPIGLLEAGHPPCSPCLHWGARRDGEYLDPLGLLHRTPIRLKPLTGDIPAPPGRMDVNFETERGW